MAEISRPEDTSEQSQANQGKSHAPVYEIGFHLVPTLTEEEAAAAFARIGKALDTAGATVLDKESPKKISLAYRIERSVSGKREKYTEGYFGFVKFELPEEGAGEAAQQLDGMLHTDHEVLRYLLIKTSREAPVAPRTVFSSRSLEGRTIERKTAVEEPTAEVSEEELDKSIEALVGDEPAS